MISTIRETIDLNDAIEGNSHHEFLDEQMSRIASTLTARPSQTRKDVLRYQPTADKEFKRERAALMLGRLQHHQSRLREQLDLLDPTVRHVLRALEEGDQYQLSELGLTDEYAWLDDVLAALLSGGPFVSIETVGPYACHHLDELDQLSISKENLPSDEKTGFMLGGVIRDMTRACTNVRMVALLDDLTCTEGKEFTQHEGDRFVVAMGSILRQYGVISSDDIPGKDYHLIRESEQVERVDELIDRLRKTDAGTVDTSYDGDVVFWPTTAFIEKLAFDSGNRIREFRRRGITLKRRGIPTCHALDATTYLAVEHNEILHLVILEKRFMSEQDKTYALVRALGIVTQERHHDVFFDTERMSPELITYAMCGLMTQNLDRSIELMDRMDEWDDFEPDEYANRNYGDHVLNEDREIIQFVVEQLRKSGMAPSSASLVADVGSGPNFYPAMILAPYVRDDGAIDLVEHGEANRAYAHSTIAHYEDELQGGIWTKFEDLMTGIGGERYSGVFGSVCRRANVISGSIFSLPKNRYDILSSYFVAESITSSRREFWMAIRLLASCVKPDGLLVVAHMIQQFSVWEQPVNRRELG